MPFVFTDKEFNNKIKEKIQKGEGFWEDVRFELKRKAQNCITFGSFSVTYTKSGKDPLIIIVKRHIGGRIGKSERTIHTQGRQT